MDFLLSTESWRLCWWCWESVFLFVEGGERTFLFLFSMIGKYRFALSIKRETTFNTFPLWKLT